MRACHWSKNKGQQFDVLVVDAFSGDSIPVHLLTREAFAVYFRHMKPDGILAVHISNHNLDLAPVVKRVSDYYRKEARLVESDDDDRRGLTASTWILISGRANAFDAQVLKNSLARVDPVPAASLCSSPDCQPACIEESLKACNLAILLEDEQADSVILKGFAGTAGARRSPEQSG